MVFPEDVLTKRERVERTLNHRTVDRVALHEQLSLNPGVIAQYTGKDIRGFDYTLEDIGYAIRQTLDMCFPPVAPRGTDRFTDNDGFVFQNDNWTTWHVSRPFSDTTGARDWLVRRTRKLRNLRLDADAERRCYRNEMIDLQHLVGETVVCNYSMTGFCGVFDSMGLELFVYFFEESPEVFSDFLEVSTERELRRIDAVADVDLSPVILIPEDFASKQGPIFSPDFLAEYHFPYVRRLTEAWHNHGIKVLYHSDGNWKKVLPELVDCGVDGFYCLEPSNGMDIVELKNAWPNMVWAGGVDGVDLMERGSPQDVRREVRRHIIETDALHTGGMFVASSSEINPTIPPGNFKAMVEAVEELREAQFFCQHTEGRICP